MIITIAKAATRDIADKDNYRPLVITTVPFKLLGRFIVDCYGDFHNQFLDYFN